MLIDAIDRENSCTGNFPAATCMYSVAEAGSYIVDAFTYL